MHAVPIQQFDHTYFEYLSFIDSISLYNVTGEARSAYGGGSGVYGVLVGKPEGKRPLGRPRRRWEDNIKMDLQEVGCGGMD
jgi:hypothetical protein